MRSIIKLIVLLLFFTRLSLACDVCGNYMGMTPYNNKNSISFLHRYRVFNGYRYYQSKNEFFPANAYRVMHGGGSENDSLQTTHLHSSKDFESYKIFELRAKYFIAKRFEINTFIPVLNNKSKTNDVYINNTGLGDISVNGGYHLILPKDDKTTKHKLVAGAGIKLPTGNNNVKNAGFRLPFEMQAGTGSTDGFIYLTYVVMHKNIGCSINANYKVNGKNKYQERMSNSTSNFATLFYKIKIKSVALYPSVQANYEYTNGLISNSKLDKTSGIACLMVGPGLDVYYKSFSLNTSWQFTTLENIAPNELESAGRISVGLNYNF